MGPLTQAGDAIAGFGRPSPTSPGHALSRTARRPDCCLCRAGGLRLRRSTAHQPAHGGPFPEATPEQPIAASRSADSRSESIDSGTGQPFPSRPGPCRRSWPRQSCRRVLPSRRTPRPLRRSMQHRSRRPVDPRSRSRPCRLPGAPGQPPTAQPRARSSTGRRPARLSPTGSIPRVETSGANPPSSATRGDPVGGLDPAIGVGARVRPVSRGDSARPTISRPSRHSRGDRATPSRGGPSRSTRSIPIGVRLRDRLSCQMR